MTKVESLDPTLDYDLKSSPGAPGYSGRTNGVLFTEGQAVLRGVESSASDEEKRAHFERLAWFLDQGYQVAERDVLTQVRPRSAPRTE